MCTNKNFFKTLIFVLTLFLIVGYSNNVEGARPNNSGESARPNNYTNNSEVINPNNNSKKVCEYSKSYTEAYPFNIKWDGYFYFQYNEGDTNATLVPSKSSISYTFGTQQKTKNGDMEQLSNVQLSVVNGCPADIIFNKGDWYSEDLSDIYIGPVRNSSSNSHDNSNSTIVSDGSSDKNRPNRVPGASGTIEFPEMNVDSSEVLCESLGSVVDDIQDIYNYLKIFAVILLILFCSLDFAKAVMSQDNDLLNKAFKSAIKRSIAAVVFIFLPTLINLIFPMAGIDNPLCGIH